MKISVSVALDQETLAEVERVRGRVSRSAWVQSAIESALGGERRPEDPAVAPVGAAEVAGRATSVRVESGSAVPARPWGHVPGVVTGRQVADGDFEREPFEG